jgi:hypothetical protein
LANNDVHDQDFDGGLNVKADPASVKPPQTTRADNAWYISPGQVRQLPAFATTLPAASQVYNIHARDGAGPATAGDILCHGEFADGGQTPHTSSLWTHNQQQSRNTLVSAPPFTLKTRTLGNELVGYLRANAGATTGFFNAAIMPPQMCQQDVPTVGNRPMFAIVAAASASAPLGQSGSGGAAFTFNASFGFVDTLEEMQSQITIPAGTVTAGTQLWYQVMPCPNTSYWCLAWQLGTQLTLSTFDFSGVQQSTASITVTNATSTPSFDLFMLQGLLHVAYSVGQVVYFRGILPTNIAAYTAVAAITPSAAPQGAFAVSCANGWVASNQPQYVFSVCNNAVRVSACTYTGTTLNMSVAASNVMLNQPSNAQSTVGPYQGTFAIGVADNAGGVGTAAVLAVTLYRTIFDSMSDTNAIAGSYTLTSIAVDRMQFVAATNTLTYPGTNYVRWAGGLALSGKAFCARPFSALGAGPQSLASYAPIRSGGSEAPAATGVGGGGIYSQPTCFLIDHQARIVGRWLESNCPPGSSAQPLGPSLVSSPFVAPTDHIALSISIPGWALSDAQFQTSTIATPPNQPPYVSVNPQPIAPKHVPALCELSLQAQLALPPAVQAQSYTQTSGCMTCLHDGRNLVEHNYHFACGNVLVSPVNQTTSGNPAGTYYYYGLYKWLDAQGRVHRSAPSVAAACNVSLGLYQATAYIPVPPTARIASQSPVVCELYRSVVGGTDGNAYLVGSTAVQNVPLSGSDGTGFGSTVLSGLYVSVSDSGYANTLTQQPRLYTNYNANAQASTYASTPPPAFVWQLGTKSRCFGLACVLGQWRLYYSSQWATGIPCEYNAQNYAVCPPDIGEARSIEAMDDKVLIFGTRGVAVMNGDGPAASNAAGVPSPGDGFSQVIPLPAPIGVLGTGAPTRLLSGLAFVSAQGIVQMGRDLTLTPIGAAVDPITGRQAGNTGQVMGRAAFLPSLQSVVWANPQGAPLVYNYLMQKWSVWPLLSGAQTLCQRLDGTIFVALQPITSAGVTSLACDLGTLGQTYQLAAGTAAQGSVGLVIETPWIQVGTTQFGEGQLYEMQIGGAYLGPHILQVEQAFNYLAYKPPKTWTINTAPQNYQYRLRPQGTSRVWSVRYRVSILAPTGGMGGSAYNLAVLSDLVLSFATKQGGSRLSAQASR